MEVTEEDYKKCNSSHPNYFSNIGNSLYRLEHSGAFYFISGVSGHCEKGQRMIIKVISEDQDSSSSSSSPSGGGDSNSATSVAATVLSKLVFVVLCSYLF
ncbi:mavicyanin [Tripterygium wilfordii]|uniref:Mavicyanin n=1 Tax=Tripterygium wilfordii TaxID=458696 RepID=A0A7J7DKR7_TRIWF|nr:mavicyanin [Tripterygium wilfordii]